MIEEEVKRLNIAVLGYTSELSLFGLDKIVKNNKDDVIKYVKSVCDSYAILKDGTFLKAITYESNMRGYKFDQLILFDDKRWLIMTNRDGDVHRLKEMTMYMSCVPEEFKVLLYEDYDRL